MTTPTQNRPIGLGFSTSINVIGCQTCSVACKVLWTQEEGEDHEWWCTVNTQPGEGYAQGMGGDGRRSRSWDWKAQGGPAANACSVWWWVGLQLRGSVLRRHVRRSSP